MSKKLIVLVALMSLALLGSSFAAVENIKVSGDIKSTAITRNLSLGSTTSPTRDAEDFLFSQVRLRFDADLTEGVSAVVELLNERNWGDTDTGDSDNDDEIRLEKAYLQLNEFLYQPLTVKIGRQNLYYGNGLIIGDPDTNQADSSYWGASTGWTGAGDLSLHKSFDAVRGTLDYAPYTIDMIYAKIDEGNTNQRDDITLWGTNVGYDWASYNGVTEGYFFATDGRTGIQEVEDQDYTYTIGGRMQMDPNDNITLGAEGAYQFGDANGSYMASADEHLSAFAAQVNSEYRFLNDYNAKIGLSYTYLSGNDDSGNNYEGWDPLFEDQTPAEIINILFENSNMMYTTLSGSMMPREDITLGLQWTWAKLAENVDGSTYSPSIGSARNNTYAVDRDETEIGNEIDAYACYDYTEDVQIKLTGAWFMPGNYFTSANEDTAYSLRAGINVDF
ncbi:MAG: hypothetical protein K9L96_04535 [Candidatus Omnitrophica bacterium]|nr:hypothetical protein [Candidatus Omnitrophota bacterium]MCF7892221.1 hypothetical protein [Candidatus Omnitrophota bacterium]